MTEEQLEKRAAYMVEYAAKNREKLRAYKAKWRIDNHEKCQARDAVYYSEHRDEILAYHVTYQQEHQDKLRANQRAYYTANKAKVLARNKAYQEAHRIEMHTYYAQWRTDNLEKIAAHHAIRRARKANAPVNDFTAAQWKEMQAAFTHRCVYCGKRCKGKLTQDHIVPLSKGGSHTLANIVPACSLCNNRKYVGPVLKPVQPLLLTIA